MTTDPGDSIHWLTASATDAGERLDRFIAGGLAGAFSRARLKTLIEAGHVALDGKTITEPSHRVKPGQTFRLTIPPASDAEPRAQAIPLTIAYEDADLIVIDKPAGMVVHPAPGNADATLVNALIAHCGASLSGIGGVKRPGIVHRIDKDTSGLLVAAKNDVAHAGLAAQFARHDIDRIYRALVWGCPPRPAGEIAGNIGRDPQHRKRMAVVQGGGKTALTRYQVLQRYGMVASLVDCRLTTGRTHQIRVHLAHIGHPLIGDPLYGARRRRRATGGLNADLQAALSQFPRQALHAWRLGFLHPRTGIALRFESPLPADMADLISLLEGHH